MRQLFMRGFAMSKGPLNVVFEGVFVSLPLDICKRRGKHRDDGNDNEGEDKLSAFHWNTGDENKKACSIERLEKPDDRRAGRVYCSPEQ